MVSRFKPSDTFTSRSDKFTSCFDKFTSCSDYFTLRSDTFTSPSDNFTLCSDKFTSCSDNFTSCFDRLYILFRNDFAMNYEISGSISDVFLIFFFHINRLCRICKLQSGLIESTENFGVYLRGCFHYIGIFSDKIHKSYDQ